MSDSQTAPPPDSIEDPENRDSNDEDSREVSIETIVEALLFATDSPVTPMKIAQILGVGGVADVRRHIATLNEKYELSAASFRIEEIANGYQMLTLPEFNIWLRKLLKIRTETRLSTAALETLAVVAYRQPVLRVVIEEIRGVAAGDMLQRLREANLVRIVGRAEEIGRPLLYGTTKRFLEVFGLASLDELPKIEALTPPDKQKKKLPAEPRAETDDAVTADSPQELAPDESVDADPTDE